MNESIKLQKYIASAGHCSRREAEKLIAAGKVKVNGEIAEIGKRVELSDAVTVNGKPLEVLNKKELEYYILNKPLDVVCTSKEQFGRETAVDLINSNKRLVTAGRLDMYTTGAIVITNDGDLINKITAPSSNIEKEYYITIKGKISNSDLEKLREGLFIDKDFLVNNHTGEKRFIEHKSAYEYKTKKAKAKVIGYDEEKDFQRISLIITEGKNRQVRRMFKALGYKVMALHRARIGKLDVKNIKVGEYKKIDLKSIEKKIFV